MIKVGFIGRSKLLFDTIALINHQKIIKLNLLSLVKMKNIIILILKILSFYQKSCFVNFYFLIK